MHRTTYSSRAERTSPSAGMPAARMRWAASATSSSASATVSSGGTLGNLDSSRTGKTRTPDPDFAAQADGEVHGGLAELELVDG